MTPIRLITVIIFCLISVAAEARVSPVDPPQHKVCEPACAFQKMAVVPNPGVRVPTVLEVPLPADSYGQVAVQDSGAGEWLPTYVKETNTVSATPFSIASDYGQPYDRLSDGDPLSYEQFALPDDTEGSVTLVVSFAEPVTISQLRLQLDDQVALPRSVEVSVIDREEREIVVAPTAFPGSGVLQFLRTTGQTFLVTFTYAQPLRITELALLEDRPAATTARVVRFLAQPGVAYALFADTDRHVQLAAGEAPDLVSDTDVRRLAPALLEINTDYEPADVDSDTVPDRMDNCVFTSNPDQADLDDNGRGDMCDDYDRDGRINSEDSCPNQPNRDQRDEDGDGIGDVCDEAESRFTEQHAWIPWAGMGFAALVLVGLFALALRTPKPLE